MTPFRPDIPPQVAEVICALHPDLKRSVKAAIRAIAANPECGTPLLRELDGLWKFRVRRFRIVYAIARHVPFTSSRSAIVGTSMKNSQPGFEERTNGLARSPFLAPDGSAVPEER